MYRWRIEYGVTIGSVLGTASSKAEHRAGHVFALVESAAALVPAVGEELMLTARTVEA
jgi:hypothetical protein